MEGNKMISKTLKSSFKNGHKSPITYHVDAISKKLTNQIMEESTKKFT